jgi:DhnA family fructose-bisphosphate aldolase class Ia
VGRNIYQRPLPQAVAVARAIGALLYENTSLEEAKKLIS